MYVIQGILVIYFSLLANRILKRKKQRLNLIFSGYYITYIVQDTSGNEATLSIIVSVIITESPSTDLDIQFLLAVTILTSGVIGIVLLFRKKR